MKTWEVETAKFRQTAHFVPSSDWPEYREYLVREREAGRVFGWTTISVDRGVKVIATHLAELTQ